jgi:hypothetical protein
VGCWGGEALGHVDLGDCMCIVAFNAYDYDDTRHMKTI